MTPKNRTPASTRADFLFPEQVHHREIAISTMVDESSRAVELSFSSANGIKQYDWRNNCFYSEILDHSAEAVDITRLQAIGVGLFNHDMDKVIGRLEDVHVDYQAKKGLCRLVFDDDEKSEEIFQKVRSGTLKGVSVGFRVYQWEEIASDGISKEGIEGPAMIARKWEPHEISIVSCPADPTVGIGRKISEERGSGAAVKFRESVMMVLRELADKKISQVQYKEKVRGLLAAVDAEEAEEAVRFVRDMEEAAGIKEDTSSSADETADSTGVDNERQRAAEIVNLCSRYAMPQEQVTDYINKGLSVDAVCRCIVDRQSNSSRGLIVGPSVTVEADERDKFRRATVDGLRMRLGHRLEKSAPGAESFRGMRLMNLAMECLTRSGESVSYRDNEMDIARRAFSTSDFPVIMTDLANVTLLSAYEEAATTWRLWCSIGNASDFKAQHKVRLGEMQELDPLLEGGEYKMASLVETKDSFSIGTFGKKFALTRQSIINDSLGAFTRVPQLFGASSARTINSAVYNKLVSNPRIGEDNKAIFHADHSNLAGTASALSVASLTAARTAMRRQKGLNSGDGAINLNVSPKYLIIPPELETLARQMLYSDTDISASNSLTINPFKGLLTPIVEADLTAYAWYLAADPSMIDTVEVAFLNGQQAPTIEQQPGWNTDGLEYKVRLDFGVWLYEYRGLYKNGGAQPV